MFQSWDSIKFWLGYRVRSLIVELKFQRLVFSGDKYYLCSQSCLYEIDNVYEKHFVNVSIYKYIHIRTCLVRFRVSRSSVWFKELEALFWNCNTAKVPVSYWSKLRQPIHKWLFVRLIQRGDCDFIFPSFLEPFHSVLKSDVMFLVLQLSVAHWHIVDGEYKSMRVVRRCFCL